MDAVEISKLLGLDWYSKTIDLEEEGITGLTKEELLELIHELNRNMISSTDNWDGG